MKIDGLGGDPAGQSILFRQSDDLIWRTAFLWICLIAAALLFAKYNLLPPSTGMSWADLEPRKAPLFRATALLALLASVMAIARHFDHEFPRRIRRQWWGAHTGGYSPSLTWKEVFETASLEYEFDPLIRRSIKWSWKDQGSYFTGVSLIGALSSIALDYILFPRVPPLIDNGSTIIGIATTNLTAYLALLAAAVSIFFTFKQLQAKVRADSRQKWVNKVRELLSLVIADITVLRDTNTRLKKKRKVHQCERRLNRNRLHLELLLNPSEKDHRLLSIIIRALAIPGTRIAGDIWAHQNIRQEIRCEGWRTEDYSDILKIIETSEIPKGGERNAISFLVKLSHVVLKREWERISHTR